MQESISIETAKIVAVRLKEARLASGMSTRAVASVLEERHPDVAVSHTMIAKYEKASATPPVKVVTVLAEVYERPEEWFLERSMPLQRVSYRCLSSRVLVRERHQFEAQAQHWLEAYIKLERHLGKRVRRRRWSESIDAPDRLAESIRKSFKYKKTDPVYSVIEVMEEYGIRVVELPTSAKIDGLAATLGDEPVVVLNPSAANDRCRLNAAHELAHVLYGDCSGTGQKSRAVEDRAFAFASSLLIPNDTLASVFVGRSAVKLKSAKEHFGISMAAMVYRAEKLGIIDARTAKKLWIQFAKRGWRANEPGNVRPDRAIRFETILDEAIASRELGWNEAAQLMSVTRKDLENRVKMAMGQSHDYGDNDHSQEQEGGPVTLRLHDE